MIFSTIKYIIISLIFITTLHYLYDFFIVNLTVPKIKDLIHKPEERYKEIYKDIKKTNIDKPEINMKNELKQYLSDLSKKTTEPISYNLNY
tara:strand:+ start:195 stop:467 length:273 start_codon:yes stop_codon:yes gene_type:complete